MRHDDASHVQLLADADTARDHERAIGGAGGVEVSSMTTWPPTCMFLPTPIPPPVTKDPVVVDVDSCADVMSMPVRLYWNAP